VNALQNGIAVSAVGPLSVDGSGTATRTFRFAPDFPGFDGHFPGAPILPAIVQIQVAVAVASEHAGTPLRLAAVEAAKFLSPVRPGEEIVASCRPAGPGDAPMHDATITAGGRAAATFLLRLVPEGGRS
jgi:3-hydroxyacyl-[acyl-carrier-protein] dehydratase